MDIKNASLVEDALARVLAYAYHGERVNDFFEVGGNYPVKDDEALLRQALFGPEGYFQNGKAVAGNSAS